MSIPCSPDSCAMGKAGREPLRAAQRCLVALQTRGKPGYSTVPWPCLGRTQRYQTCLASTLQLGPLQETTLRFVEKPALLAPARMPVAWYSKAGIRREELSHIC